MPCDDILLAGALPGEAAGNSVSTDTLLAALLANGPVRLLTHETSLLPHARVFVHSSAPAISLGVQPLCIHGEATVAARVYRRQLRAFSCGWAVNSRYACALRAAGVPYLIWEPTVLREELAITDMAAARHSGRGSGLGVLLHKALLPIDERLEGKLYRGAVAVLAMSEYTAGTIRSLHGLGNEKLRVLAHPPPPAFLDALARARREVDRRCGKNEEIGSARRPIRLLFVGRVDDPRKNFLLLRDAFETLEADSINAMLTVVGPHNSEWRRSLNLENKKSIQFTGEVPESDLVSALLTHDALVVPSRQEGLGIVVTEAMHAGLPVVSTRCGGPEQMLRESGGGILVEHSPRALAAAIHALAADPALRAVMGRRGRKYAEHELSTGRFQERVAQELELLRAAARLLART